MASKRRRRMEVQESSLFLLVLFNLVILESISFSTVTATPPNQQDNFPSDYPIQNHHLRANGGSLTSSSSYRTMSSQQQQADSINSAATVSGGSPAPLSQHTSTAHLCSLVPHDVSKHLKLCKLVRHSPQANEAVTMGASKGLAECRAQFSKERWNCTHLGGEHHLLVSELTQSVGNREGGFIQAIAAAGIVHSIATACSVGSLSDCACDKTRIGIIKRQEEYWKWGGCSNNIRHGMLYAKHLVELLDVAHEHHYLKLHNRHHLNHQQTLQQINQNNYNQQKISNNVSTSIRHFEKRSLSSNEGRQREFFSQSQLRPGRPLIPLTQTTQHQPESNMNDGNNFSEELNFCKQNHNISKTIHIQLIKSLLSKNSLEKHQEIRLAMNMHNNKIGRMAVSKNMEIRCRCHGLSGSCSLKTCWLLLPSFQTIGNYLKKKYELSVHLPSAIDLNKLIPMMNRNEITAILNNKQGAGSTTIHSQPAYSSEIIQSSTLQQSQHQKQPVALNKLFTMPPTPAQLYNYNATMTTTSVSDEQSTTEIPTNLNPMTQQQYQALLRDMKLCDTYNNSGNSNSNHKYHRTQLQNTQTAIDKKHHHSSINNHNGHHLKQASQQLSHLLQPYDKDALIHLHKSPSYCEPDNRHGFAGIQSRICNKDKSAPNSCDKLCCGRGSRTIIYMNSYKCECKFQYCCSIFCNVCQQKIQLEVCN